MSLPVWERGLKQKHIVRSDSSAGSLPVWERGLKPGPNLGCHVVCRVAPRVGAWIETMLAPILQPVRESLPVWERGLKLSG